MRLESWEGEDPGSPHPGRQRYCQEFLRRLPEALEELFPDGEARLEIVYWGKGRFYGFLDLSDLRDGGAMRRRLDGAALACSRICGGEPYSYGIGVSAPCMGENAIQTAYRQVNELMKLRFYLQHEILYYDAGRKTGTRIPEEAKSLLARMETYRDGQDAFWDACAEAGRSFERKLVDERLVRQWLWELEQKAGLSPEGVSRPVSAAAKFAQRHFREPVGLTEAAQVAGVNPTYLSYLFRKEMGIGFSNFLLDQRMECAMALLRNTPMKVREVAERSGFHDYHYFAKVFKKRNGLCPAEYRKQAACD